MREEFEESNAEKEKDESQRSRELGEERKARIEETKRLERLYAPPLPFSYRKVEKQLDEKFKKNLGHLQMMEMKIPFLDAMA